MPVTRTTIDVNFLARDAFEESKHPRKGGKFTSGSGGAKSSSKKETYHVYAPTDHSKPHVQSLVHKTTSLEEAKSVAEEHVKKAPDGYKHKVHVDGDKKQHFINTKNGKWASIKR